MINLVSILIDDNKVNQVKCVRNVGRTIESLLGEC